MMVLISPPCHGVFVVFLCLKTENTRHGLDHTPVVARRKLVAQAFARTKIIPDKQKEAVSLLRQPLLFIAKDVILTA
jgi:hypothetical protein